MITSQMLTNSSEGYNLGFFNGTFKNTEAQGTENSDIIKKIVSLSKTHSSLKSPMHRSYLIEERKRRNNLHQLEEISNLDYNWNGNGASPFSSRLISEATKLFNEMKKQPKIFPTARNSIQFEFEKENGNYLEFEIFERDIEVYSEIGEEETEYNIRRDSRQMNRILFDFYGL